ncbi:MAG: hypothetical protein ACRD29_16645 [Acidimicrobiales bacterium]
MATTRARAKTDDVTDEVEPAADKAPESAEVPEPADGPEPAAADRPVGRRAPPKPKVRGRSFPVAAALAGIFAVVAIVMTVVTVKLNGDLDADRSQRADVRRLASEFSDAFLAYEYQTVDRTQERVLSMTAEPFRSEYERTFSPELVDQIVSLQMQVSVTIKDIYIGDIGGGEATVVIAADRTRTSTRGPEQENDVYYRLDLLLIDGDWKVVGLSNLNLALSQTSLGGVVGSDPGASTENPPPTSTP